MDHDRVDRTSALIGHELTVERVRRVHGVNSWRARKDGHLLAEWMDDIQGNTNPDMAATLHHYWYGTSEATT